MADLKLGYDPLADRYDLVLDEAGLPALEIGLRTAAIAAVLSWAHAREGDPLPGFDGDRKGHWADPWAPGGRKGSLIWLLFGRIVTPRTVADAKRYLEQGLRPLLDKGLVREIVADAWRSGVTRISGHAVLVHLDGTREVVEFENLTGA